MRLTDSWFEARFVNATTNPDGYHDVATFAEASAVFFYCPCAYGKTEGAHGLCLSFEKDGNQGWKVSGTVLADLTLEPSIAVGGKKQCWHGYVRNGEVLGV
jgi:hypothetical protein